VSLKYYMDHNVRREITDGLRRRGVDVLTAHEDGADRLSDPELLDRATALGRVLFTRDEDLIREAIRRQQAGEFFAGVIYAHQLRVSIGQCVTELELIAQLEDPKDYENRLQRLPLSP
jgi:predicted nuclease of predicted toxin-antitoxin system